jgi:hypothetical protein
MLLSSRFPHSYFPAVVSLILMASILYKSHFPWLVKKFLNTEMSAQRQSLVDAVVTLQNYEVASLAWNEKKRRNLKFVGWEGKQQAMKIGYIDHIDQVESNIKINAKLANRIAEEMIEKFELTPVDLRSGTLNPNSRAIEAITHYARDWTPISEELDPLLKFISQSVDKYVENKSKTIVIVPGSGLGRIAHEVSQMGFARVETVEFSGLMYLCNEFVYGPKEKYDIHPFLHSYSHHTSAKNHTRHVQFERKEKPDNLILNYGDFRDFQVENIEEYDQVVVLTAFFMDTAQNLFDYFQAIETVIGSKKGLWINVGPLKYGTAPFVELSLEEIRKLREIRGWKDLDEPKAGELAGYLTDTEGLWQGYYGLGKWVSSRN